MRTVNIDSDGSTATTVVRDATTHHLIQGVRAIRFEHLAGSEIPVATIEIFCPRLSAAIQGRYTMQHPTTGELKEVRRIEFGDGSTFEG